MELIISDISGEKRVVVEGKGWVSLKKVRVSDVVKCKEGWINYCDIFTE